MSSWFYKYFFRCIWSIHFFCASVDQVPGSRNSREYNLLFYSISHRCCYLFYHVPSHKEDGFHPILHCVVRESKDQNYVRTDRRCGAGKKIVVIS